MPRSRATIGAETMLMLPSPTSGTSRLAIRLETSGFRLRSATVPTNSISISLIGLSVT